MPRRAAAPPPGSPPRHRATDKFGQAGRDQHPAWFCGQARQVPGRCRAGRWGVTVRPPPEVAALPQPRDNQLDRASRVSHSRCRYLLRVFTRSSLRSPYSAPHIASASALISACANERTMPRSRSVPACAEREVRHLDSDHAGQVLALERASVQDAAEGSAKGPNLPYEAEMKADHAIVAPDR
jgi:hypothetical protein